MKKYILGAVLSLSALPAVSESNMSGELILGSAKQTLEVSGFPSVSESDTSIGLRGAFSLNDYISFELAYFNYGEAKDSYVDSFGDNIDEVMKSTAVNLGAKASIPFESGFSIDGRIGLASWSLDYEYYDSFFGEGLVAKADDSGTDLYYGVGVSYKIGESAMIGAEYTVSSMDASLFDVSVDHEVKNMSISAGFRF
ncbi:MAG: outer membrane beta-barrel protein [Agarilytica sp.]